MSQLKRLSGKEAIAIFKKFGFEVHSQRGSHIKLRRTTPSGKEILTIPNHRELATGWYLSSPFSLSNTLHFGIRVISLFL